LLRTTHASIDRRDAGFTLVEVLIALAVVAVSIVAIGSVMSTNLRGVRSLEQHVTLMQTARAVLIGELPASAELGFGALSGQVNDHQWRIDVEAMGEEWDVKGADVPWKPALVSIRVRSPSGALSDLKTVRLVRGPSK
jgi:general secretion pathway protein I